MNDAEMARLYELISLYLDATLDAHQEADLLKLLERSGNATEFVELTRMDREIAGLYTGPVSDAQMIKQVLRDIRQRNQNSSSRTSAIMQHVRVRRRSVRKHSASGAWLWIVGAAAAIVLAVLAVKNSTQSGIAGPARIATLLNANASTLIRAGKNVTLAPNLPLLPKDVLSTGTGGGAVLRYPDGTQFDLRGESSVTLDADATGFASKLVLLDHGAVFATAAAQPPGHPLVVRTPAAEAVVIGTQFTLSAEPDSARLDVLEGKVKFVRRSDAATVDVAAGNFAVAQSGVALAAAPMQPAQQTAYDKPEPLPAGATVLWQDKFSAQPDPAWIGSYAQPPVKGLRDRALKARAIDDRSGTGTFFCDLRSPRIPNGFSVGPHTYLRFRVLPVKYTRRQVIKVMFKRADEMNYGAYIVDPVPDRWQTFTVRLDDHIHYMDDYKKKLEPGEQIHWLIWEGLNVSGQPPADAALWLEDPVIFEATGDVPGAISLRDSTDQ